MASRFVKQISSVDLYHAGLCMDNEHAPVGHNMTRVLANHSTIS